MKRLVGGLLLALLLALPARAPAATVTGRVVFEQQPLAGMQVSAYRSVDFTEAPVARADRSTDADGLFRLEVPDGDYALFARNAAGTRFAFSGRNPLPVTGAEVWAGLQAVAVSAAETGDYQDEYSAALEGVVTHAGAPLADAVVYLYLDATEALKGQGYRMSLPTAADGRFYFDALPEASYFLAARLRRSGAQVGPVRAGDLFGIYPGNPVTLQAGRTTRVRLPLVEKLKEAAASETLSGGAGPRLTGLVVDAAGEPVAGLHVFAYTERVIGHQRPAALSAPTAADGRFSLVLPEAGTYYVGARELYGDSPAPGERFGMYEGSADHGIAVAADGPELSLQIEVAPIDLGIAD